jgi:hypothetical protein
LKSLLKPLDLHKKVFVDEKGAIEDGHEDIAVLARAPRQAF